MTSRVVIDPARREMSVGEIVLPVDLHASDGSVQALPPSGPRLRPITFGERYRLVELAAASADPAGSLRRALFDCACVAPPAGRLEGEELAACEALALHLAGAGIDAPPYADTMILIARSAGWGYGEIEDAEAARADRLARRLRPATEEADDGWNRFVFTPPAPREIEAIVHEMAVSLLERFDDPIAVPQPEAPPADRPDVPAAAREHAAPSRGGDEEMHAMEIGRSSFDPAAESAPRGRDAGGERNANDGEEIAAPKGSDPLRRSKVLGYALDWGKKPKEDRRSVQPASTMEMKPAAARPGGVEPERSGVRLLRGSFGAGRSEDRTADDTRTVEMGRPATPMIPASPVSGVTPMTPKGNGSPEVPVRPEAAAKPTSLRAIEGTRPRSSSVEDRTGEADAIRAPRHIATHQPSSPMPGLPASGAEAETRRGESAGRRGDDGSIADPLTSAWTMTREDAPARWSGPAAAIANAIPGALAPAEGGLAAANGGGLGASLMEIADALADMLDDEADLRGLDR